MEIKHPYTTWPKDQLVNWDAIVRGNSASLRRQYAAEELARLGDSITITDTLLNDDRGGLFIRERLADEQMGSLRDPRIVMDVSRPRRTFRLKWHRHADGTPAKPGDKVSWKVAPLDRVPGSGAALTTKHLRTMRRRGEATEFRHAAVLDADCCIYVPFSDAALLLSRFGAETAHYKERSGDGKYNWLLTEEPEWLACAAPVPQEEVLFSPPQKRAR